jgi:hypothetical protein
MPEAEAKSGPSSIDPQNSCSASLIRKAHHLLHDAIAPDLDRLVLALTFAR